MSTNTNNPHSFLYEKTDGAGPVILKRGVSVSNTTIAVGDPLVLSSGYIKLAGTTSTGLYGFAMEKVTGAAGVRKSLAFIPAQNDNTFSAQHGGTLNLTAGNLGKRCGIASSTGVFTLNAAATTSVLQIMALKPGSKWGTYCELLVKVVRSTYDGSIR